MGNRSKSKTRKDRSNENNFMTIMELDQENEVNSLNNTLKLIPKKIKAQRRGNQRNALTCHSRTLCQSSRLDAYIKDSERRRSSLSDSRLKKSVERSLSSFEKNRASFSSSDVTKGMSKQSGSRSPAAVFDGISTLREKAKARINEKQKKISTK
jgi:hypothetical protein